MHQEQLICAIATDVVQRLFTHAQAVAAQLETADSEPILRLLLAAHCRSMASFIHTFSQQDPALIAENLDAVVKSISADLDALGHIVPPPKERMN